MASVFERNGKYCVIYNIKDQNGKWRQKWETYRTKAEAKRRRQEIDYRMQEGTFTIPKCTILRELLNEYVSLYGKDRWSLSTYSSNEATIRNYILPLIGETKLQDINTRFLEKYYQSLQKMKPVVNGMTGTPKHEFVSTATIRDIHKLLRNCFEQAVKWELMEKNPATHATTPKHKAQERDIWTAETVTRAVEVCEDQLLSLAINLAFAGSMRMGEILGLTWDCVDISPEAVAEDRAFLFINKEMQRVSKSALKELDKKDVLFIFPSESRKCTTVCVLKTPKTESSIRKVFLPASVAELMGAWKKSQDELKELLGDEYRDYGMIFTSSYGMPYSDSALRKKFNKLIEEYDLPRVVFHSLRHSSITYKLKLNGGDIKAVQGDSGHAQVSMVTDVYSHIIDEDRRKNAKLFEEAFYGKKNLDPQIHGEEGTKTGSSGETMAVPEGIDPHMLEKVLSNPEMAALLTALAKTMETGKN